MLLIKDAKQSYSLNSQYVNVILKNNCKHTEM